jgi:hypothetical protein
MALGLQDALEQAFGYMAEYEGLDEDAGGSLVMNVDFGASMRDSGLRQHVNELPVRTRQRGGPTIWSRGLSPTLRDA